jgi:hypothetical protein
MKKYLILLLLLIPSLAWADYTCTVPTDGTFTECITASANQTGVVTIDVISETITFSNVNATDWLASSIVIKGAGSSSTTSSNGVTITVPVHIPLELYGFTFGGIVYIDGNPRNFKIHDNDFTNYNLGIRWYSLIAGTPSGVIYKNNLHTVYAYPVIRSGMTYINEMFNTVPPIGTLGTDANSVVYVEGNTYLNRGWGYLTDGENSGRLVWRFNTVNAIEANTHWAVHSINNLDTYYMRGHQMWEIYHNLFTQTAWTNAWTQIRSGSGTIWNNSIVYSPTSGMTKAISFDNVRSFSQTPGPIAGLCRGDSSWDGNLTIDSSWADIKTLYGDTHFSGTHTGNGTDCTNNCATLVDSTAAWNSGSLVTRTGYAGATVYNTTQGKESYCVITANNDTTLTCTLSGGKDWDIGDTYRITDGYPCRDQIGRSYDSVAAGSVVIPYVTQSQTSVFVWGNLKNGSAYNVVYKPNTPTANVSPHIISNRDYHTADGASCTAGGACTTGVGSGTSMPTTCTTNVGFWRTDESKLYKCTATNTWTEYYSPATCPHTLTGLTGTCDYTKYGTTGYNVASGDTYTLTVAKDGTGTGTITSSDARINCGSTCGPINYNDGYTVVLVATPAEGSTFTGWDGAVCTGTDTCTLTMSANKAPTATFTEVATPHTITVIKTGLGSGTITDGVSGDIDCGSTCTDDYNNETSLVLTATPADGSTFLGWTGAGCSGTGTCEFSVTEDETVYAEFTNTYLVTITKAGQGVPTVTADNTSISCGSTCSEQVVSGTQLIVRGSCASGTLSWSGDCTDNSDNTCTASVTAARNITATCAFSGATVGSGGTVTLGAGGSSGENCTIPDSNTTSYGYYNIGRDSTKDYIYSAQSFTSTSAYTLKSFTVRLQRSWTDPELTITGKICTDNAGEPSTTCITADATVSTATFDTSSEYVRFSITAGYPIANATRYHFVLSSGLGTINNYWKQYYLNTGTEIIYLSEDGTTWEAFDPTATAVFTTSTCVNE